MSVYDTYHIRVSCDHDPDTFEEDKALREIACYVGEALEALNACLPDGWSAEEVEGER